MIKPLLSYVLFAADLVRGRYHSSNGREARLLEHVLKTAPKNDPKAVLDCIDHYAHSQEFYMNVGDGKGKILVDELHRLQQPRAILVSAVAVSSCTVSAGVQELSQHVTLWFRKHAINSNCTWGGSDKGKYPVGHASNKECRVVTPVRSTCYKHSIFTLLHVLCLHVCVAQELGTYCGYSTILLASELKDPTAQVYTIDICEDNVEIAKQIIAHAGQNDKVVHVVKPLEQAVQVSCLAACTMCCFVCCTCCTCALHNH